MAKVFRRNDLFPNGPWSAAAHDSHENTLDRYLLGCETLGGEFGVVRDEPDSLGILPEFFQGGLFPIDECHHPIAISVLAPSLQNHQIPIQDAVLDHGIPPDSQNEKAIPVSMDAVGHFKGNRSGFRDERNPSRDIAAEGI